MPAIKKAFGKKRQTSSERKDEMCKLMRKVRTADAYADQLMDELLLKHKQDPARAAGGKK